MDVKDMGGPDVPESDWKTFRELRERALEGFSRETLSRVREVCEDTSRNPHERYREIYRYLRDRDEELARAFDDPRRSRMIYQLVAIQGHGLLEPEEFDRFSEETRSRIAVLTSDVPD